jgi:hypothetical protein
MKYLYRLDDSFGTALAGQMVVCSKGRFFLTPFELASKQSLRSLRAYRTLDELVDALVEGRKRGRDEMELDDENGKEEALPPDALREGEEEDELEKAMRKLTVDDGKRQKSATTPGEDTVASIRDRYRDYPDPERASREVFGLLGTSKGASLRAARMFVNLCRGHACSFIVYSIRRLLESGVYCTITFRTQHHASVAIERDRVTISVVAVQPERKFDTMRLLAQAFEIEGVSIPSARDFLTGKGNTRELVVDGQLITPTVVLRALAVDKLVTLAVRFRGQMNVQLVDDPRVFHTPKLHSMVFESTQDGNVNNWVVMDLMRVTRTLFTRVAEVMNQQDPPRYDAYRDLSFDFKVD